ASSYSQVDPFKGANVVARSSSLEYVQVYRNGCAEALTKGTALVPIDGIECCPTEDVEIWTLCVCGHVLERLRRAGLKGPVYIGVSILQTRGRALHPIGLSGSPGPSHYHDPVRLQEDRLIFPEILMEAIPDSPMPDLAKDLEKPLKPVFDQLWQAAGYARSFDYDEQGEFLLSSGSL
ncbi:MAG: hypothetical protein ACP5VE_13755, partial [Chthonomonadales bacterium]